MICSGAAWWYEYYAPDRPQFKQCQEDAQKNKRGLWAEEEPVAPWDWRKDDVEVLPNIMFRDFSL